MSVERRVHNDRPPGLSSTRCPQPFHPPIRWFFGALASAYCVVLDGTDPEDRGGHVVVEVADARRSAIEEHHRDEPDDSGYAPTQSTESLGNCVPVPGLVTPRGPASAPAVIRRSITVGSTAVATPADFLPLAKRKSWDAVELKVLQFMCDDTQQD